MAYYQQLIAIFRIMADKKLNRGRMVYSVERIKLTGILRHLLVLAWLPSEAVPG